NHSRTPQTGLACRLARFGQAVPVVGRGPVASGRRQRVPRIRWLRSRTKYRRRHVGRALHRAAGRRGGGAGAGQCHHSQGRRVRVRGGPGAFADAVSGHCRKHAAERLIRSHPAARSALPVSNAHNESIREFSAAWSPVMKRLLLVAVAFSAFIAVPVLAAFPTGAKAPVFSATASRSGQSFHFSLADALAKGPVVVYFYPAAYTGGCDLEAHTFATHKDAFTRAGATIIGVSADSIERLDKFSADPDYCAGKFAVASDPHGKIAATY